MLSRQLTALAGLRIISLALGCGHTVCVVRPDDDGVDAPLDTVGEMMTHASDTTGHVSPGYAGVFMLLVVWRGDTSRILVGVCAAMQVMSVMLMPK